MSFTNLKKLLNDLHKSSPQQISSQSNQVGTQKIDKDLEMIQKAVAKIHCLPFCSKFD